MLTDCDDKFLRNQLGAVLGQLEPIQHQLRLLAKVYASMEDKVQSYEKRRMSNIFYQKLVKFRLTEFWLNSDFFRKN